jgi:hypothetical protein
MNLKLEDLKDAMTYFSNIQCLGLTENCIVALEDIPHKNGCELEVSGLYEGKISLDWDTVVNKNGYKEKKKFTEKGAEALSFFLAMEFTEYEILEESEIGTGVDYWLGYGENHEKYDPLNFFNARLEISGILRETPTNSFKKRIEEKKKQTNASNNTGIPAYVSVIEFSNLKAHITKK